MNYYEQTEEYLKSYIQLKACIRSKQKQIDTVLIEDGLSAMSYEGEKTAPTFKISQPTERVAVSNVIKIDRLKKEIERNALRIEMIDNAINTLDDIDKDIIKNRYIEGYQWWKVAQEVNLSRSQCLRRHIDAIEKISIALFGEDAMNMRLLCDSKS